MTDPADQTTREESANRTRTRVTDSGSLGPCNDCERELVLVEDDGLRCSFCGALYPSRPAAAEALSAIDLDAVRAIVY